MEQIKTIEVTTISDFKKEIKNNIGKGIVQIEIEVEKKKENKNE